MKGWQGSIRKDKTGTACSWVWRWSDPWQVGSHKDQLDLSGFARRNCTRAVARILASLYPLTRVVTSPPRRFPPHLLLTLLLHFHFIFYFPDATYWIFLLFLPWLPCHFYLVVIEQQHLIYRFFFLTHFSLTGMRVRRQYQMFILYIKISIPSDKNVTFLCNVLGHIYS